jgi:glyoxylase-like metal-dependent hydrolase (beta-lactamase superfamily II)
MSPIHAPSRRDFLKSASLAAAAGFVPRSILAQVAAPVDMVAANRAEAAKAKLTLTPLRGNVSVLMGTGGNIAVLTGRDGKLLVDSGYSSSRPHVEAALLTLDHHPIRNLINTHWHFDHTDGNEWVHSAGATITAHRNTLTRLSSPQPIAAFNYTFPAAPRGARPTVTFADDSILTVDAATLVLHHYEPAHTDTDISVNFIEADVFHAGDTWFNGFYPFIDYSTGGSIDGMIRAAYLTLSSVSSSTILIPGHGPVGSRADLLAFRDMLSACRDSVAALKSKGMSIDQVLAAKPNAAFDAKWGGGFMKPDDFARLVYQGV